MRRWLPASPIALGLTAAIHARFSHTFTVTHTRDDVSAGTLRWAILAGTFPIVPLVRFRRPR